MTAGIPGTGIGGLFYLISALLMPFRELFRALAGRGSRERGQLALQQSGIALTMLGTIWLTGLALGLMHIGTNLTRLHQSNIAGVRVFYVTPVLVAVLTLTCVLLSVEVARVVMLIKFTRRES